MVPLAEIYCPEQENYVQFSSGQYVLRKTLLKEYVQKRATRTGRSWKSCYMDNQKKWSLKIIKEGYGEGFQISKELSYVKRSKFILNSSKDRSKSEDYKP